MKPDNNLRNDTPPMQKRKQPMFIRTLVVFLLLHPTINYSQENSFTLQQAIEYALKNQANIRNAQIDEEIAAKKVHELIGIGTPQLSASADLNKFIDIPVSFVPGEFFDGEAGTYFPVKFGQPYSASAGLSLTQLLFDGSYLVGLQASRTYLELSRKQTRQSRTETAVTVSKAYYGALVSNARLEFIEANLQRIRKLLDDTRALQTAGFAEKLDVDRIELNYNNLSVEKEKILRFRMISYALLKFQMGFPPDKDLALADSLDEMALKAAEIPEVPRLENRPEIQVLTVSRQLQSLDLKRNKAAYLPSLVAFGRFSYNNARTRFDFFEPGLRWFPTTIIGAQLNIPIWDGLQKNSRVTQSKLNLQKVDNALEQMKNGFQLEMQSARINFMNYMESLAIVRKNRELATEIARVSKIKYESGVGSGLELVNAESDLREAEANYFNTLYETIIARIDLDKSAGILNY